MQTFGCVFARTASRAFSRSPCGKGPRLPPPDTGLRGSWRRESPELALAGAENFLSPANAEYLGQLRKRKKSHFKLSGLHSRLESIVVILQVFPIVSPWCKLTDQAIKKDTVSMGLKLNQGTDLCYISKLQTVQLNKAEPALQTLNSSTDSLGAGACLMVGAGSYDQAGRKG